MSSMGAKSGKSSSSGKNHKDFKRSNSGRTTEEVNGGSKEGKKKLTKRPPVARGRAAVAGKSVEAILTLNKEVCSDVRWVGDEGRNQSSINETNRIDCDLGLGHNRQVVTGAERMRQSNR
jgi:hypothetical protein